MKFVVIPIWALREIQLECCHILIGGVIVMVIPSGKIEYKIGTPQVSGCGLSYSNEELEIALEGPVAEVLFDGEGKEQIKELLEGLAETDFERQQVERILLTSFEPEPWRVGEALAESYLSHHRNCFFPWPVSRDERKARSSLPGADLVGIIDDGVCERFVFGEVKTSSEKRYPPQVMYGPKGLKQQLEDLKDKVDIRDTLVRYLLLRVNNTLWKKRFDKAAKRYLGNNNDVYLFGILIRDVEPHVDDLRVQVDNLGKNCPQMMSIELLAIYLPNESIKNIGGKIKELTERKMKGVLNSD